MMKSWRDDLASAQGQGNPNSKAVSGRYVANPRTINEWMFPGEQAPTRL
jgi:hypothetical protein